MTSKPRVLVTGGAGFIGSQTCKELAGIGIQPIVLDNLTTGHRSNVQWGPIEIGDVRDTKFLARMLRKYNVAAVMHFAALAYVRDSFDRPSEYYDNNVNGVLSLLNACRETGVDQIIFSSSCATYGIPKSLPITEADGQHPINPYGRTKLMGELILRDYAAAYGLRFVVLRYFNACGADPDCQLSEKHDPETHIIPLALMAANGRLARLDVFGDDHDTPDGTCVRDFVHVKDLAAAHVNAFKYLQSGGKNTAVNLGSGKGLSIREIVSAVERTTGRSVPVRFGPRHIGDPPILLADPSLAKRTLGFEARYSDIDRIIRDAAPTFGLELAHA